eukprot:gb/GECH01008009.1/.p1 GENE.gb/GECH01008009.1/~~gb/GECH01008009.1/.p1  ORF type:complete len:240 (+),score=88.31 gb/GECH01008009.1/:1-720(+)
MNKDGKRLCDALERLGYPNVPSPDALDWCFDYEEIRPLIEWICSSLTPDNVLSPQELEIYRELEEDGKVIENQGELEKALKSVGKSIKVESESINELKNEIDILKKEELEPLQQQLSRKVQQRNVLHRIGNDTAPHRREQSSVEEETAATDLQQAEEKMVPHYNLAFNEALDRLRDATVQLCRLHHLNETENKAFLSWMDFNIYNEHDDQLNDRFDALLQRYFTKTLSLSSSLFLSFRS